MYITEKENTSTSLLFKLSLLITGILLIIIREPVLLLNVRFWAEEGPIYYKYAYENNTLRSIFSPHLGYLAFYTNIIFAMAAKFLNVKNAPFLPTYMAFMVQLLPLTIVVFGNFKLWISKFNKLVLGLLIIIIPHPESWLNSINSQFFFATTALLIIFEANTNCSTFKRWILRGIILLAGLTGPLSCFLIPVFLLKYYNEKQKETLYLSLILIGCALIQTYFIIDNVFIQKETSRFHNFDLESFIINYCRFFFTFNIHLGVEEGKVVGIIMAIFLAINFCALYKHNDNLYYICGFLVVSFLSLLGSVKMMGGGRYNYLPNILLILFFFNNIHIGNIPQKLKTCYMGLLILLIPIHLYFYRSTMSDFYKSSWPIWKEEVKVWESYPEKYLQIHPQDDNNTWKFRLSKRND